MAGIMRLVQGVVAKDSPLGVVPGTSADDVMAKIDGVSIALQTETLTNNGQNQIAGAESAWGLPVTAVGSNTNWYKVQDDPIFNGHTSLAVRQSQNGFRIATNPLAPFPKSYLILMVCSFTQEALDNTTAQQLLVGVKDDNLTTKTGLRFFSTNFVFSPNEVTTSSFLSVPRSTLFTANKPTIIGVHWNNDTHTYKLFVDDFETPKAQNTNVAVSSTESEEGDRWDFLRAGTANVGGVWGNYARVFVIDSAIMDDPIGKAQMLQAVAELKTIYGIA